MNINMLQHKSENVNWVPNRDYATSLKGLMGAMSGAHQGHEHPDLFTRPSRQMGGGGISDRGGPPLEYKSIHGAQIFIQRRADDDRIVSI